MTLEEREREEREMRAEYKSTFTSISIFHLQRIIYFLQSTAEKQKKRIVSLFSTKTQLFTRLKYRPSSRT